MLSWFLGRRTDRFDPAWEEVLKRGVWQYRFLDQPGRVRVREVVAQLVAGKNWTGGGGFAVTDTMRVTVAGVSGLMTLGVDEPFFFPKLKTFILYPTGYSPEPRADVGFLGPTDPVLGDASRLGEAWQRGPVILAWRTVERQARVRGRGRNLVLHEMAHHLDGYNGDMDGVPHFDDAEDRGRWYDVTDEEYHRLVGQAQRREVTLLDHYGATNRAEFFAVASECFFERPHAMRQRHAELFGLMAKFYRQDPTAWLPPHDRSPETDDLPPPAKPVRKRAARRPDLSHLGLTGADELFSQGVLLLGREEYAEAERVFTEVLRLEPDDGEAHQHRGEARLALGDFDGAVHDSLTAIRADPDDVAARLTHAAASLERGGDAAAERSVDFVLREERDNAEALFLKGRLLGRAGAERDAANAFRRVVQHDPFDADAHFWLAFFLERTNNPKPSAEHLRRAFDLDPSLRGDPPKL